MDDIGYMAQAGATSGGGSPDGGAGIIGNYVLSPDVLAVRVVLFGNHDAGYLTRTFPTTPQNATTADALVIPYQTVPRTSVGNQGAQTTYGGSISLLYKVSESFEARLRVMYQDTDMHGFPATFAPLPEFQPEYILNRAFDVQPDAMDRWALPSLELNYKGNGYSVVSSSSYFYRHTHDLEDSTYGTEQAFLNAYGVTNLANQPLMWDGERYHNQLTEELRLSFDPVHNLSGTAGAFYSYTRSLFFIPNTYAEGMPAASIGSGACALITCPWPNDLIWTQNNPGTEKDTSVFGELYYKFLDKFSLTAGVRKYWLKQTTDYTANGFLDLGPTPSSPTENSQSGADPKVGLSYQATEAAMLYASASKGFRAGGAQANFPTCQLPGLPLSDIEHIQSDTLWSYEAGTKIQVPDTRILLTVAGFHINWDHLQQQVALNCGFYLQLNGGSALINGGEIELTGKVTPSFQLRFGAGFEKTDIVNPGPLSHAGVMPGMQVEGVPAWTASVGGIYTRTLTSELDGFVEADYSYTGNSISLLNGGLIKNGVGLTGSRPPYSLANLRFGVKRDKQELSLNFRNIGNAKPNLGDIGYVGYAQFSPAGVVVPQVATLQPFTVLLQYRNNF
jgi:outer membrane receptor protein involved in Fe transport